MVLLLADDFFNEDNLKKIVTKFFPLGRYLVFYIFATY